MMFETIADSPGVRFRRAALAPVAAFLLTQLYFGFYPVAGTFVPFMFYSVVAVVLAGTLLGAVALVGAFRDERVRGVAAGWAVLAVAAELLCARLLLSLTLPWI